MLLLLGCLAGCGPSRVALNLQGVSPLNVNSQNESTAVDVRFYQLTSDTHFHAATVDQLWTDPKKALGDQLVGDPISTTVYPAGPGDQPTTFSIEVQPQTAFLGILAQCLKADAEDHRMLVVPLSQAHQGVLVFTGYAVALKTRDEMEAAAKAANSAPSSPTPGKGP